METNVIDAKAITIRKSLSAWQPNLELSNLALAYYESPEYGHRRVFPVCPVDLPSGHFYEFRKEDLARNAVQQKPPHGTVAPAVFGISEQSYSCKVYQVLIGLDKLMVLPYQRTNAPGSGDPERARVQTVTEQLAQYQEISFAEKFFKSGAWANEWTGAETADPSTKKFLKFDDSGCDPVEFIDQMAIDIRRNGRRKPNKLALGVETFKALKNNKAILNRIKYSGTQQNPAIVNENVLAQVFGVDSVVVLDATYNAAGYGKAADMQYVCDSKGALLLYAPDSPQIDSPSAGYCFSWLLDNNDYIGITTYEGAPATHTDIMEGLIAFDLKKTSDDLAVYLTGCCD